ncbi:TetR/AcrR family transcriptional regulator [Methylobacterium sp. EM32]|uniref:TetR/AcrR family transcriptional regulator n=1 Tax=Methylobacterium sp. EM32 TaxID=3163481 RepID=UPI0033AA8204
MNEDHLAREDRAGDEPAEAPDDKTPDSRAPGARKRPSTRRQLAKNEATRAALVAAAGRVVGRHGYAGASIARITAEAGIAHGAFYLHFASRQALFDVLLLEIGNDMLDAISAAIRDSRSLEEIERRGITANFAYLAQRPEIDRVMNEAEVVAPDAFNRFMRQMQERYRRSLIRSREAGELRGFSDDEIEVVAALLTGARSYLLRLFARSGGSDIHPLAQTHIDVYLDVFLNGIRARSPRSKK